MRFLLALLIVTSACAPAPVVDPLPFAPAGPDAGPAPWEFGPFPVGVRTETFADTGRKKPDGGARLLVTELWYPATQDTRGQPGVDYDVTTSFTPDQQAVLVDAGIPILHTAAVRDAKVALTHGPFPLVLFSHGMGAMRWQSTYYTVLLASHGYVVVAPDLEGGTLDCAVRNELQNTAVGLETRPQDLIYLMNRLQRLPADHPLAGAIDMGRIGVTGHSFGALTSERVAALDPRVKVIVPQAPTSTDISWLGLAKPVTLGIPVMIQAAHDDQTLKWDENIVPSWPQLQQPRWLVDFSHGGHFTFSDLCGFDLAHIAANVQIDIPGANVQEVLNDGCGPTAPTAAQTQPLINLFAVGLFNSTLRNSPASAARLTQDAAEAVSPGVVVLTADP
jgi:predicted dienelactone hydrolase